MNDNHNQINCDKARAWILDKMKEQLPGSEEAALEGHILQCEECRHSLEHHQQLRRWLQADQTPEPNPNMYTRFYDMLDSLEEPELVEKPTALPAASLKVRNPSAWLQVAATILLIVSGIVTGYWLGSQSPGEQAAQEQMETMAVQIQQMRQVMMLALLQNPSASERLQAVSLSNELDHADEKVIDALLTTLSYDTNVNVRLMALDALLKYADSPQVREGLIQSLAYQKSPLVQIALADLMVKLQEKRAVKALRGLLRQKGIRSPVKARLEHSIVQLT